MVDKINVLPHQNSGTTVQPEVQQQPIFSKKMSCLYGAKLIDNTSSNKN